MTLRELIADIESLSIAEAFERREIVSGPLAERLIHERAAVLVALRAALIPSAPPPPEWVDFVQGVADARNGSGVFWLGLAEDQDVIDRMGDAAVAMLAARPAT